MDPVSAPTTTTSSTSSPALSYPRRRPSVRRHYKMIPATRESHPFYVPKMAKEFVKIRGLCNISYVFFLFFFFHCERLLTPHATHTLDTTSYLPPATAYITHSQLRCIPGNYHSQVTSKTPRQRPSFPHTPASSRTSRIAVTLGSSSGSTPPPGTIQWSGRRDDVTSSTCTAYTQAMQRWHGGIARQIKKTPPQINK